MRAREPVTEGMAARTMRDEERVCRRCRRIFVVCD